MKRVLLVNPPQKYQKTSTGLSIYVPLGLIYLAAKIRDICQVEIYDCIVSGRSVPDGDSITYGDSSERIREVIIEKKPDILGITVPFTAQYGNAATVARICREVSPETTIVFGGPDPSVRFKTILQSSWCDYCVIGEGEQTFYEFINTFPNPSALTQIPGVASKNNGDVRFKAREFLQNLDELPYPAFDLVDMNGYLTNPYLYRNRSNLHKKSLSLVTSRGCPYSCVFCSIKIHMGNRFRAHSPDYILKLLRQCIDEYGIRNYHFEDDNLTFDKQRFEEILDRIIAEKLDIHWDTPNGIRADRMTRDLIAKAKRAGCYQLSIAVESGVQRVLDEIIRKKAQLDRTIEVAKWCYEFGIHTRSFFVIGFPGETIREMRQTTDLAVRLFREYELFPTLMVATPLYGTELYEICVREGYIQGEPTPEELSVATQAGGNHMITTPDFSKEDITQIILEYNAKLKREQAYFAWKHPLYTLGLLKQRVLRKLLKMR